MTHRAGFPALPRAAVLLAVLVSASGAGRAHDFWIEPSSFRVEVGASIRVGLTVGENMKGEAVPRKAERIESFVIVGTRGEAAVSGEEGKAPAGLVTIAEPGIHVIGYRSRRSRIELSAEDFEAYLLSEGIESVSRMREQRGESGKPAREVYSRCAKALVSAGDGHVSSQGWDRLLGFALELLPGRNPYAPSPSRDMPVRILYQGKPLAGTLIVAIGAKDPARPVSARSDDEGRALLPLHSDGMWLVKAVHMTPAPPEAEADWESLWASLTFEIEPSPAKPAAD